MSKQEAKAKYFKCGNTLILPIPDVKSMIDSEYFYAFILALEEKFTKDQTLHNVHIFLNIDPIVHEEIKRNQMSSRYLTIINLLIGNIDCLNKLRVDSGLKGVHSLTIHHKPTKRDPCFKAINKYILKPSTMKLNIDGSTNSVFTTFSFKNKRYKDHCHYGLGYYLHMRYVEFEGVVDYLVYNYSCKDTNKIRYFKDVKTLYQYDINFITRSKKRIIIYDKYEITTCELKLNRFIRSGL